MRRKNQDTYKEVREYRFPNAIVRVHIPDLTEDERARRMKRVEMSAAELIKEVLKMEGEI